MDYEYDLEPNHYLKNCNNKICNHQMPSKDVSMIEIDISVYKKIFVVFIQKVVQNNLTSLDLKKSDIVPCVRHADMIEILR